MTYSCTDFTDDIMNALINAGRIDPEDIPDGDDTASAQADLALAAISRLQAEAAEVVPLRAELASLKRDTGAA
jgi:hypothetical protein